MRLVHRRSILAGIGLALAVSPLTMAAPASAAPSGPPAPPAMRTIEPLAAYVPQTSCDPHTKPGAAKLGNLLTAKYPGTIYYSPRPCDRSVSEHYEGRAIDWMVHQNNKTQKADGDAVLKWLFATDKYGNKYAEARRLGVMYIVYNNRIWGAWDEKWEPYDNCAKTPQAAYDNSCHRTHMHLSLSWAGAMAQTSFWTGRVAATDYGPCVLKGLNWAPNRKGANPRPCAEYPRLTAAKASSALYRALVPFAGARVSYGSTGPIVSVIQRAVGLKADGDFGPQTRTAVKAWQTAHHIAASGKTYTTTWRALLASLV